MQEMVSEIRKAEKNYSFGVSRDASELVEHRKELDTINEQLQQLRVEVNQKIEEQNASVQTLINLESQIYGNLSKKIVDSMGFSASR